MLMSRKRNIKKEMFQYNLNISYLQTAEDN